MLVNDIELYKSERKSSKINYDKLGRGDLSETAFVLGKIILETMNSGIVGDRVDYKGEKCHLKTEGTKEIGQLKLSDPFVARKNKRQVLSTSNPEQRQEKIKKQRLVENGWDAEQKMGSGNQELFEKFEYKKTNEEHQMPVKLRKKIDLSTMKHSPPKKNSHRKQRINDRRKIASAGKNSLYQASHLKMNEHDKCTSSQSTVSKNHQVIPNNCNINVDVKATDESDL
ncbi:putative pol [Sesbania bispinosa]|nr:putative pol [Sesbania bispinosa]